MKISDNIFSFHQKILWGYIFLVAVIASMAAILVHERERIREIEVESAEIRQFRRDINATHSHIIRLATLGESVTLAGRKPTASVTVPSVCTPTACCKP